MAAPQYRAGSFRARCGLARLESSAITVCVARLGLTGCGSTEQPRSGAAIGNVPLECAPFARAVSGVELRGAAADWWPPPRTATRQEVDRMMVEAQARACRQGHRGNRGF